MQIVKIRKVKDMETKKVDKEILREIANKAIDKNKEVFERLAEI